MVVVHVNTIPSVSISVLSSLAVPAQPPMQAVFPPLIRHLSAAFTQEIHSVLHRIPGFLPQFPRFFSTGFAHVFHAIFFIYFCVAFPHDLADSAGEKNGESAAVLTALRKNGRQRPARKKQGAFPQALTSTAQKRPVAPAPPKPPPPGSLSAGTSTRGCTATVASI